jgi:pSer/pThr/pTyr-binding forkhead associated (FHA) protein
VESYVEVWGPNQTSLVPLSGARATLGRKAANTVVLDDPMVSNFHAVLEQYPTGWCLRDVGSSNGSFVNGDRLLGERHVHPGDEIRLGGTRIVLRAEQSEDNVNATARAEPPPTITRRERDVLVELCRPLLGGAVFNRPATTKEIAAALVVSEAAVKAHLINLYDKFGIYERAADSRRVELANAAVLRRAVSIADLNG